MTRKSRSLIGVAALALGLSLLPAGASAQTWGRGAHRGPRVSNSGRFGGHFRGGPVRGHGRAFVGPTRFGHRGFVAGPRFHHRFFGAGFHPFRVVRVFVYDPFPHWVVRRIYYDCDPYDPYCP